MTFSLPLARFFMSSSQSYCVTFLRQFCQFPSSAISFNHLVSTGKLFDLLYQPEFDGCHFMMAV
jgi:hypothetical protein